MYRCIFCQKDFEGEDNLVNFQDLKDAFQGCVVFNYQTVDKVFLCDKCFQEYLKAKNFEWEV